MGNATVLDQILSEGNFSNHDLVAASPRQLSHKNVQKARTGSRRVPASVEETITLALNALVRPEAPWRTRDLFPHDIRRAPDGSAGA